MRLLLVAAVTLGGAFGSASVEVETLESDVMVINMEVQVMVSTESVVAHLSFDDDPSLTIPLLARGGGIFGVRTELQAKNYVVVFEAIGPNGETSEPVSMTQMGADLSPRSGTTTTTTAASEISPENRQMLWLAIAAGAASLSALAFWVLGPKDDWKEELVSSDEEE